MEIGKFFNVSIITTILFLFSCVDKKSKDRHFSTKKISENLYREKYRVFSGGAYSAELYADYITDSVSFRKYIGTHDPSEGYSYKCNGDSIFVTKAHFSSGDSRKIIEKSSFSITALKNAHKFE